MSFYEHISITYIGTSNTNLVGGSHMSTLIITSVGIATIIVVVMDYTNPELLENLANKLF